MSPLKNQEGTLYLEELFYCCQEKLLFRDEQVFLLMTEVWLMHDANTQYPVGGEKRPKGKNFYV